MRELNSSENKSSERLEEGLRTLAARWQAGASPELGESLAESFRHHHARRRAKRRAAAVVTLLALAVPAVWFLRNNNTPETRTRNGAGAALVSPPPAQIAASRPSDSGARKPVRKRAIDDRKQTKASVPLQFVPLPAYDGSTPTQDARVIRLRISGRALRMVGAPVNAEDDGRRLLADFVVGQDGTPYAVRLVQ